MFERSSFSVSQPVFGLVTIGFFFFLTCWSVIQSCPTLCDPINCSKSSFQVLHYLPEFAQTQCSLSRWCHPTISSSVAPFSSCPQPFPPSESFPVSWLFVSASKSVLPTVKNLPAMQETRVPSLGWEDPLEKGIASHSILAWRIPWTE